MARGGAVRAVNKYDGSSPVDPVPIYAIPWLADIPANPHRDHVSAAGHTYRRLLVRTVRHRWLPTPGLAACAQNDLPTPNPSDEMFP